VLAAMSMAVWKVGTRAPLSSLFKIVRAGAAAVAMAALLGPPTVDLDFTIGIPVVDWVLGTMTFLAESLLMTGGRLLAFGVAAAITVGTHLGARATKGSDRTFHSLLVPLGGAALAIATLWVVPFGHYFFNSGEPILANGELCTGACFDPGTVAMSTKLPWTVLLLVSVFAYFVTRALVGLVGSKRLRPLMVLGWFLSLPVITLFVYRDPDFSPATEGGGFDFLSGTDVVIWLGFAVVGGAAIAFLSLPQLGEPGRFVAALTVVGALLLWVVPMLMRIRLFGLLFAMFAIGAQTFAGDRQARMRYVGLWVGLVTLMVIFLAAIAVPSSVEVSGKSIFGGLMLTFVLALTSIALSVPIGILMALGRTSSMPIFRVMSTVYIELVRGIPFITILIFFDLILVLFLPQEVEFDSVMLAILGGLLFSAAYMAENIRGGLQSIPKGQYEAAKAMGLSTLQMTVFIVLPQALRAVIPALVGQTIAIFKDTSLVAIVGLFDFLFIADKVIPNQTAFIGIKLENILFIAVVYWIFTFSFSRASLRVEKKVGLGER
jgi:general L-amino acid transport system permease protein